MSKCDITKLYRYLASVLAVATKGYHVYELQLALGADDSFETQKERQEEWERAAHG